MSVRPSLSIISDEPVVIPNCWYPIVDTRSVSSTRPLGLMRLGQRWVLWRDPQGAATMLPAACPHRGVDRALGKIRNGELECPYHGFRFTPQGRCTAVPCQGKQARIPAGLHQSGPPLREVHGLIWMWHGDAPPTGEPPWRPSAPEPGPRCATHEEDWAISFTRVMEGMQDLHHFPFAHKKLDPWRGRATVLDPYVLKTEGDLLIQQASLREDKLDAKPVMPMVFETVFPALVAVKFGTRVQGAVATCPIDDDHTWVWIRYRVESGWGSVVDRLASWFGLWTEFALVQPDDQRMLAASEPQRATVYDQALVKSDAAIAAWHRLRRQRLKPAQPRT